MLSLPAQVPVPAGIGNPFLNTAIFAAFVLVTLVVVFRVSRSNRTTSDYYAAGRGFTGPQNGVAIAGDYLSAASFLGIAGAIAVIGYDGFLYSVGFLVAWLVALLLELYGDEWLVIPAMHYRWSVLAQQREFVLSEFGRLSMPEASYEEQIAIGERTSRAFSGMVPALGITEHTIPGIEAAYLAFLDQLDRHLARFDFLLGSRPSIGDYGFMGPLYAHLGRDPVPLALMRERAPHVSARLL